MKQSCLLFVFASAALLWGTTLRCRAQTTACLPPPAAPTLLLHAAVNDDSGQVVDSVYVSWQPATNATAYHYEVAVDGIALAQSNTTNTQFNFSLLPLGWNVAEVSIQTLCTDGTVSEYRTASIVATVDEVYKIYQSGDCNSLGACSACLCQSIELLLDNTTPDNQIDNTDFLGIYGCASFLNRFILLNQAQLSTDCPCFVPKQACYDNYPCSGFNCNSTGLREAVADTHSWRVQNNAEKGSIIVEYALNTPKTCQIYVYDLLGKPINTPTNPENKPYVGQHRAEIYLPNQGIYIAELRLGGLRERKKVMAIW